jgi:formiminotetrahydrofolate cyclodeaminase
LRLENFRRNQILENRLREVLEPKQGLDEFVASVADVSPLLPGGGSVAAFAGSLAAALGEMTSGLTEGRNKFAAVDADVREIHLKLTNSRDALRRLVEEDAAAFNSVMDALKLPKETDEEKALRQRALESSTYNAALVPAEVISTCKEILPYLEIIAAKGNRSSLSDTGVAVSLIGAAAEGAFLNVLINYSSLQDKTPYRDFLVKHESAYSQVIEKSQQLTGEIIQKLRT